MFSLHLKCRPEEVEHLSLLLWEAGTVAIREEERGEYIELAAGFDAQDIALEFPAHEIWWEREDETDWVAATKEMWPGRAVGERLFLVPFWNTDATPRGRLRIVHNPGLASGTGEHPCTQLALQALETCAAPGVVVTDIGTGSGILAIAAMQLGAKLAAGVDTEVESLAVASENFGLNDLPARLVNGSADCLASESADIIVANIAGTVLLSLADELLRIARPGACLILTGFPEAELKVLEQSFGPGEVSGINEWRCLVLRL